MYLCRRLNGSIGEFIECRKGVTDSNLTPNPPPHPPDINPGQTKEMEPNCTREGDIQPDKEIHFPLGNILYEYRER